VTQSDAINELAAALAKAQAKVKGAAKDKSNPHFRNDYADLASIWDACREAITSNGLSVVQTTDASDGTIVTVYTTLLHQSGQWLRGALTMKPQKVDPQGIGSCITYARRYALAAIVGVAPEDDDGNAASQPETRTKAMPKPDGYDDNLLTLEALTVPEARKAFANWPGSHRDYFTTVDKTKYDAFKQKGAQHDAEQRKTKGAAA
jgi:hypothetical protein